jgi:hypothetical protein
VLKEILGKQEANDKVNRQYLVLKNRNLVARGGEKRLTYGNLRKAATDKKQIVAGKIRKMMKTPGAKKHGGQFSTKKPFY